MERSEWDGALRELGGHLLQSWGWGEYKRGQGWRVERLRAAGPAGAAMAQVLFRHRGPVSLAYVPRGPALGGDPAAAFAALVPALDAACRRHRAVSLLLEPDAGSPLAGPGPWAGFRPTPRHFQPPRTVKVPLASDEALLGQMHTKTRQYVRLAQRRGYAVERVTPDQAALAAFYGLLEDTARRNAFAIHPPAYYAGLAAALGEDLALFFVRDESRLMAGQMVPAFGVEAISLHGASSTEHRAQGSAEYLDFEAMRWARGRGCTHYDLWGIPNVDPPPEDRGASRGTDQRGIFWYKTRFGGEIVSYPAGLERRYRPVLASLVDQAVSMAGGGQGVVGQLATRLRSRSRDVGLDGSPTRSTTTDS